MDKSPYHNRLDVAVKLKCGCYTKWHDGFDLWQAGQYAYCDEHGDTEIAEILEPENEEEE